MSIEGRFFNCVEVLLITGHEGLDGRYRSTLSLTLALDGWVGFGAGLDGSGKSRLRRRLNSEPFSL
jgi:hypothetical protein